MHNYHTLGTEVEVIAVAQLSKFDIVVYTQQNNWVLYLSSTIDNTQSDKAFSCQTSQVTILILY